MRSKRRAFEEKRKSKGRRGGGKEKIIKKISKSGSKKDKIGSAVPRGGKE